MAFAARLLLPLLLAPAAALAPVPLTRVARAIKSACAPAGDWPEPEVAAAACDAALLNLADGGNGNLPLLTQGELSFEGTGTPHDERYAVAEPLAHLGDAAAMQTAGILLFSGVGGAPLDVRLSAQWHAAAAAQGNVDALATLGGCVRRGVGAERSEAAGLRLIEAAAAAGSPVGLVKLGVLCDEGEGGLAQDSWRACQLFEQAAADGRSALGLFNHGWSLVHGIGTARDVDRGLARWRAAAALAPMDGSEEAAYFLWDEAKAMAKAGVPEIRPADYLGYLELSAALGYEAAARELARRATDREDREVYGQTRRGGRARFIRDDKARAWTQKEERSLGAGE